MPSLNFQMPQCCVYNVYGPTEATITATALACPPSIQSISIGRPVYNLHAYVVDSALRAVPVGVPRRRRAASQRKKPAAKKKIEGRRKPCRARIKCAPVPRANLQMRGAMLLREPALGDGPSEASK